MTRWIASCHLVSCQSLTLGTGCFFKVGCIVSFVLIFHPAVIILHEFLFDQIWELTRRQLHRASMDSLHLKLTMLFLKTRGECSVLVDFLGLLYVGTCLYNQVCYFCRASLEACLPPPVPPKSTKCSFFFDVPPLYALPASAIHDPL